MILEVVKRSQVVAFTDFPASAINKRLTESRKIQESSDIFLLRLNAVLQFQR